jgi:hypothetical protein
MLARGVIRVPLTVKQILQLAEIVDNERKRTGKMIEDNPAAVADNEKRRGYIARLNRLTSILMASTR